MLTLNDKPLATWYDGGNAATFKLEGSDDLHAAWDWAKTLEGQDLTIKQYGTASDPIYVSTIDGNVWAPDSYPQGWQLEKAE